jgi:hypothetical protein
MCNQLLPTILTRATLKASCFGIVLDEAREPESRLLGVESISLRAQAAGSGARLVEVAAQSGNQEGAEDDIGTPEKA